MKRLLALLAVLPCILCSCDLAMPWEQETTAGDETTRPEHTDQAPPAEEETTTLPDQNPLPDAPVYTTPESVPRFSTNKFQRGYYGFSDTDMILTLNFPSEWTMQEGNNGLSILHGEKAVGRLVIGDAEDNADWKMLTCATRNQSNGTTLKVVESQEVNGRLSFRYRYVYTYGQGAQAKRITLTADCAEIGTRTEQKLMNGGFTSKYKNQICGTLMHLEEPQSILVLGNSFIGSSNIVSILQEMLTRNGKSCTVYSDARGGALVGNFANDTALMNKLRSGKYDLVLMGGFYGGNETVQDFNVVQAACRESNTALVMFPAHNENESVISMALSGSPTPLCLHWKKELDLLIEDGVDRWDLCVDDYYDHSKPLAGYVGAHMVYRALYGEAPANSLKTSISQGSVNSILGDYVTSKDLRLCAEADIIYLS